MGRPRRVLLVTCYFPPTGAVAAFRLLSFARHLPHSGWEVGVVAPGRMPCEPCDEALARQVPPETIVFSVPFPNSLPARLARKFIYHGVWLPRALPALVRAIRQFSPDVVLTSGPPHCIHFLGLLVKWLFGVHWVADFRDPWFTNTKSDTGWFPWARWERYWEERIMRRADCVVANTPLACRGMQAAYPASAAKIVCVTNGFDREFFPPSRQRATPAGPITMLHAGELYQGRDPRPLLAAMQTLEETRPTDCPPLRLRLLGLSTDPRLDLAGSIRERGLRESVEVAGHVPYAEALAAAAAADILLLLDTPGRKISIPAKLFEYIAAGRPILALTEPDGDVAWALQASGATHRIAPALDVERITQAVRELRDEVRRGCTAGASIEQASRFDRAKLASDLAAHLHRLLVKTRASGCQTHPPDGTALEGNENERCTAPSATSRAHYARA
jgi:glycosyltransferase involved in cell wall biosynthesis